MNTRIRHSLPSFFFILLQFAVKTRNTRKILKLVNRRIIDDVVARIKLRTKFNT